MKYILTTAILVGISLAAQADDKTATEKARDTANAVVAKAKEAFGDADRATRTAWAKTTAYLSNELAVYRAGGD